MTLLAFASLLFGTFISEDLACVTAGLLIQRGELAASIGILACTLGIFVGDVALWAVGRLFGQAVLGWPWIGRQLQQARAGELREWLERHAAGAILASRFLPGTRLPLYLVAGILKLPVRVFAAWALLGTLLWTPALVLLTARLGDAFAAPVSPPLSGIGWVPHVLIALGVLSLLHLLRTIDTRRVRTAGLVGEIIRSGEPKPWPVVPNTIAISHFAISYVGSGFRSCEEITLTAETAEDSE